MVTSIGIGIANAIGFNRAKKGGSSTSPKPIASYRAYDKTNDDADRNVLTDLTGNGHDIQLYNFEFAEGSGYGKYSCYMNDLYNNIRYEGSVSKYYAHITKLVSIDNRNYINLVNITSNFKVSISGVANDNMIRIGTPGANTYLLSNGIYTIDISKFTRIGNISLGITGDNTDVDITIELLPDYQGALVSDGVDDYGLCENFPILTKEKGYTVCAIRAIINTINLGSILGNGTNYINGSFLFEYYVKNETDDKIRTISFGSVSELNPQPSRNISFIYQTKDKYNGKVISTGNTTQGGDTLALFVPFKNGKVSSIAIYALEIYDRDLTDEEIAKVKARMIAEYEEKIGNKYEEETA